MSSNISKLTLKILGFSVATLIGAATISSSAQAATTYSDLLAGGEISINDGRFITSQALSDIVSGTGTFDAFLGIQEKNKNATGAQQGYNSDRKQKDMEFDEKSGAQTNSIKLSDVQLVGGWRVFMLDINETAGAPSQIDLTGLRIFETTNTITGTPEVNPNLEDSGGANLNYDFGSYTKEIYNMDAGDDATVVLDYDYIGSGSGRPDLFFLLRDSLFDQSGNSNIVLYSSFLRADAGFEEWGVGSGVTLSTVPLPAALPLFGAALFGLGLLKRRKVKAS